MDFTNYLGGPRCEIIRKIEQACARFEGATCTFSWSVVVCVNVFFFGVVRLTQLTYILLRQSLSKCYRQEIVPQNMKPVSTINKYPMYRNCVVPPRMQYALIRYSRQQTPPLRHLINLRHTSLRGRCSRHAAELLQSVRDQSSPTFLFWRLLRSPRGRYAPNSLVTAPHSRRTLTLTPARNGTHCTVTDMITHPHYCLLPVSTEHV